MTELQFERLFWILFSGGFLCGAAVTILAFIAVRLFKHWRADRRDRIKRLTGRGK
jgi:uncharacterized membrane protein YciS (DUF1049 family)